MTITPAGGGAAVPCGPPINPSGTINAALGGGPRGTLGSSLNFELPLGQLNGSRRLDVTVFVSGHENDPEPGWKATGSVTVNFLAAGGQEILPWLIADSTVPGSLPNIGQFGTSLGGALARHPIAQTGFTVNPAITGATMSQRTAHLDARLGATRQPPRGHVLRLPGHPCRRQQGRDRASDAGFASERDLPAAGAPHGADAGVAGDVSRDLRP